MKQFWMIGALAAPVIGLAGAVGAAPRIDIDHAVARVTVILEPRGDVVAEMVRTNPRFPIRIRNTGEGVDIRGDLDMISPDCRARDGRPYVSVWLRGGVAYDDMPQVVVRAPMSAAVHVGGAVYGAVGRGETLSLANSGCGDWVVADQTGDLRLDLAGSGDVRAGSAGRVEVHTSGSSDVALRAARNGLAASIAGSGDVDAAAVNGPLRARVTGSGDVRVKDGSVSDMGADIAGSGNVDFGGTAAKLDARIAGSGDIHVARVTGAVFRRVVGSGDVTVGR